MYDFKKDDNKNKRFINTLKYILTGKIISLTPRRFT